MRNYQAKNNNPYRLPHNLYMRMLYLIKDYERLKEERKEIMYSSPVMDGMPRGNGISTPTENKGEALAAIETEIRAIENAALEIPEEYRGEIVRHIIRKEPYPYTAGEATWKRWQARLVYYTAKNLRYVN